MELNVKFKIEQIAICPQDPIAAKKLLSDMGATEWSEDHVVADGFVFGETAKSEADLSFNYSLIEGKEFEVLHYTKGNNWMKIEDRPNSVSHLGMHCTEDELFKWIAFFVKRNIDIAQEVQTTSHTNLIIAGKRTYLYMIFDTKSILGVDLKFIVRRNVV